MTPDASISANLIRFLASNGHPYLAFLVILGPVFWGLKCLLPIRLNLSVGDRQEPPNDKR